MLGIRKFRGCQLDLWVGEQADFVVDHLFKNINEFNICDLSQYESKHIAIAGSADITIWKLVKVKLNSEATLPYRATLILNDVKTYDMQQEELFKNFP